MVIMNKLVIKLIFFSVKKEHQIYISREELSIFRRASVFLILNVVLLLLLNFEIYGFNLGKLLISINSDW